MKMKRNLALAALGLALGAVLVVTQAARSDNGPQSCKVEGSWVGKVTGTPVTWSYALMPDPSGRTAAMAGSVQVPLGPSVVVPGLFPDLDYYSPMVGQVRMTGPDTMEGTALGYGMKKGFPFNQIVCIWVNNVQSRFVETGKIVATNHLAFYAPSADADGDGIPDPNAVPALCLPPSISLETRVPIMPPCTP
jgi:hypothetical protein